MQACSGGGRAHSHLSASTSAACSPASPILLPPAVRGRPSSIRPKPTHVARALFDPPPFSPDKLSVSYRVGGSWSSAPQPGAGGETQVPRRCYTLTHNDITGALSLTVDTDYNYRQISGFYTKLLRDEVIAEWRFDTPDPSLHVYCYVSGTERWLAPAPLRNYIFRREIPLVLDTFIYADRHLLEQHPELAEAEVYVHFNSSDEDLNKVELWGTLCERSTWQVVPTSLLKRALWALSGQQFQQQQEQQQQQGTVPSAVPSPLQTFQSYFSSWKSWDLPAPDAPQQPALPAQAQTQQQGHPASVAPVAAPPNRAQQHGHSVSAAPVAAPPNRVQQHQLPGCERPRQAPSRGGSKAQPTATLPIVQAQSSGGGAGHLSGPVSSNGGGGSGSSGKHRSVGYVAIDKSELVVNRGGSGGSNSGSSSLQWQQGPEGITTPAGAVAASTDLDLGACLNKAGSSPKPQAVRLRARS